MSATTVRLPDELGDRLERYCATTGAVKNRVIAIALRSYLGDPGTPSLPVTRCFDETEPETTPLPLPAREQIVLDGLRRDLDAHEVAER